MRRTKPTNLCDKTGCYALATRKWSNTKYCEKHFRFKEMRHNAKSSKKYVPSYDELENLYSENSAMICRYCGKQMHWRDDHGKIVQLTFQHRDDGLLEFICHGCNNAHGHSKMHNRDYFLEIPIGMKWCPRCKNIYTLNNFYKNKDRFTCYCRDCTKQKEKIKRMLMAKRRINVKIQPEAI
jgi:hypothetical protein